nr:hypothetical protein [Tanacetum cinerariifolium]
MTLEEIKVNFDPVWKQIHDFIPIGSKEEAERFKRKGIREDLNQLWALVKESLHIRPALSDKEMELWVELKRLYTRLPVVQDSKGRIVGNKMHKAFPLPVIEFPLPKEVPTASEESSHCQKKRDATAEKIALLLKSSSNCQSKSNNSYA